MYFISINPYVVTQSVFSYSVYSIEQDCVSHQSKAEAKAMSCASSSQPPPLTAFIHSAAVSWADLNTFTLFHTFIHCVSLGVHLMVVWKLCLQEFSLSFYSVHSQGWAQVDRLDWKWLHLLSHITEITKIFLIIFC